MSQDALVHASNTALCNRSSANLVGGPDYSAEDEDWRSVENTVLNAGRQRRMNPLESNVPCENCGWNNEFHFDSCYFSKVCIQRAVMWTAAWKLGDQYLLKVDHLDQTRPGRASEVATNRLLREKTSLPVRGEGFSWRDGNSKYQVLPFLQGKTLREARLPREQENAVWHQVGKHLEEIRKLQSDHIVTAEGTPGGGGYYFNIAGGLFPQSREELLKYLQTSRRPNPNRSEKEIEEFRNRCPDFTPYVFTHADLDAENILIDDNNHLVAIIDWEHSGYYPFWWEWVKAERFCRGHGILKDYIGCYPEAVRWMRELSYYYPSTPKM